jgi:hypothetical protein
VESGKTKNKKYKTKTKIKREGDYSVKSNEVCSGSSLSISNSLAEGIAVKVSVFTLILMPVKK